MTTKDPEQLLIAWGKWQAGSDSLLFSKVNILGKKVFHSGEFTMPILPDMDEDIQQTDLIICKMPQRTRMVVKQYYSDGWTQVEISMRNKRLTRSEVRSRLDAAVNFLEGHLAADRKCG